jgi:hypothetical protein
LESATTLLIPVAEGVASNCVVKVPFWDANGAFCHGPPWVAVTHPLPVLTARVTTAECVTLPLVPVMVRLELPAGVEVVVLTVSVDDPELLTDAGLKLAVVPAGKPETASETLPLKPLIAPTVAMYVVLLPAVTVCDAGVAESEKSATAMGLTVRVTVAECVTMPLVPVMVNVAFPAGVALLVVTVSVDEPEPLTVAGLKLAVAPEGNPVALKDTLPVKPFTALMLAV